MNDLETTLKAQLKKIMENTVNDVSKKIFECLKKHIEQDMYQPNNIVYIPSLGNKPSYEFLRAIDLNNLKSKVNAVSREIVYNWETMSKRSEPYTYTNIDGKTITRKVPIHESVWGEDVREALFEILQNRNNRGCMPNRPVAYYKDFWEEFKIDVNSNLKLWIEDSFRKQGFNNFIVEVNGDEIK